MDAGLARLRAVLLSHRHRRRDRRQQQRRVRDATPRRRRPVPPELLIRLDGVDTLEGYVDQLDRPLRWAAFTAEGQRVTEWSSPDDSGRLVMPVIAAAATQGITVVGLSREPDGPLEYLPAQLVLDDGDAVVQQLSLDS
jgi:hypothetical protein